MGVGTSVESRMRSLKISSGETAKGSGSDFSTLKFRSGTGTLSHSAGPFLQVDKELLNGLPGFCSARKAAPVFANKTDEFVAFVYGHAIIRFRPFCTIYEQRLDVRLQFTEYRVLSDKVRPRLQLQERLGSPGRARVHGDDALGR